VGAAATVGTKTVETLPRTIRHTVDTTEPTSF
jgi:hypothetical protein